MYQALYRKWRPITFDDVCGQDHITDILKFETSENRISHAYLFCGPRGTGKTTCAKILSKAINCLSPVNGNPCGECEACKSIDDESSTDVLEMDAASNNGVDAVRAIRDEVVYTPSSLKYRVYIVDEVHMLSISAFNALLKTLEEPPAHVVFILATTELQKLPATIISRCQRFDFRRIPTSVITSRLMHIAKAENIALEESAARVIAKHANGGMRDAISLLDLCSSGGNLTSSRVENLLGISSSESILNLAKAVLDKDFSYIFDTIHNIAVSSVDMCTFWQDVISLYRDMLVVKTTSSPENYIDSTSEEIEKIRLVAENYKNEKLLFHIQLLDDAYAQMQRSGSTKRMIAEMTLLKMCNPELSSDTSSLISRISELEEKVNMLSFGVAPVTSAKADKKESISEESPKKVQTHIVPDQPVTANNSPKRLSYWLDIAENLSKEYRGAMGLRNGSRAYIVNDNIVVKVKNSFTIKLMSEDNIKNTLATMVSSKEGKAYSADSIIFELLSDKDANEDDLLDTLI